MREECETCAMRTDNDYCTVFVNPNSVPARETRCWAWRTLKERQFLQRELKDYDVGVYAQEWDRIVGSCNCSQVGDKMVI